MSTTLLSQVAAFRLWNSGELMTYVEFNEQNAVALQSVLHLLGRMCIDTLTGDPASGFVGDDCLPAKGAGALDYTIEAGLGFQYVSASSGTWEIGYQPILVTAQLTGSVGAHDATLPRIDLLVIKAATSDDSAENRSVKNVSTGAVSSQSVNTRRVGSATVQVVAGTPDATPSRPSVPSGYIEVAQIAVPATSGDITVTDTRPRLSLGQDWTPDPAAPFAAPHVVPGFGGNLNVTAGAGLDVEVAAGEMWFSGRRHRFNEGSVTMAAAHSSMDRIDLVVLHRLTGLRQISGTASATPSGKYSSLDSSNEIVLASVYVAAGATTLSSGDITDERDLRPYDGDDLFQPRRTKIAHLDKPPVVCRVGLITQSSNTLSVPISIRDSDGLSLAPFPKREHIDFPVRLLARVYDDGWERMPSSGATGMQITITTGTAVSTTGTSGLLFDTDDTGEATLIITRADPSFTGTIYIEVAPCASGETGKHGFPVNEGVSFV